MRRVDAAVIGGGLLGCFTARNLRRWQISTVLLEAESDVCTGISRANSAIVYAGYDNQPGSLKAQLTVSGNAAFDQLCRDLEVPFSRCGSLMVSCGPESDRVLEKKLRRGLENGVPGLRLLTGAEARAMEPMLSERVTSALYAPTTGTVNPWQLGIAAFENAVQNGCKFLRNAPVTAIEKQSDGYLLQTPSGPILASVVFNCAGLQADRVQELLFPPKIRLRWDAADYLVLDSRAEKPSRVIFHQAGPCGKGITAIPCTEGNLLLSGGRRPLEGLFATTGEGLQALRDEARGLLPNLVLRQTIREFGAVRPNPYGVVGVNGEVVPEDSSIGSFCVENPAPGFYSLIGIKTPGLTCADGLGRLLAEAGAADLQAERNGDFDPRRPAILQAHSLPAEERAALVAREPDYGQIVCLCDDVTRAEVLEAIRRGAVTVDGVKRRTGCTMGRCQGSRCSRKIEELLGLPRNEI